MFSRHIGRRYQSTGVETVRQQFDEERLQFTLQFYQQVEFDSIRSFRPKINLTEDLFQWPCFSRWRTKISNRFFRFFAFLRNQNKEKETSPKELLSDRLKNENRRCSRETRKCVESFPPLFDLRETRGEQT